LSAWCADPFIKGAVPNEAGFEGATHIVEEAADGDFGYVTAEMPYLDVHGHTKMGQGRLIVRQQDLAANKPIPLFCHVHYEKDVGGAKHWCKLGWAVTTAHYGKEGNGYPIDVSPGDGFNLARAVIQWARRIPFIDRTHVHIDGGSQGGYMALAMSADFFPVAAATADFPVVNWAYNFSYFEANKALSKYPQTDMKNSPFPFLCAVTGLVDDSYKVFGNDLKSETWYYLSPISYLDAITNPVLVMCATGDMLVPLEQMTRKHLPPFDPTRFPEGYKRDFDSLTLCEPARKTFEELLPPEKVWVHMQPLQEDSFEVTLPMFTKEEKKPEKRPKNIDRPWSKDHQWSLCYLDEGGPSPYASHATYEWDITPDSFVEAHRTATPPPGLLTASKLDRLMQRYAGQVRNLPKLADGQPANRLNYPDAEKRDVLAGLLDYAQLGESYAERLQSLYHETALKPFGDTLDLNALRSEYSGMTGSTKPSQGGAG
jgi:hypothetical protein